jgi:hypothetical protein
MVVKPVGRVDSRQVLGIAWTQSVRVPPGQ